MNSSKKKSSNAGAGSAKRNCWRDAEPEILSVQNIPEPIRRRLIDRASLEGEAKQEFVQLFLAIAYRVGASSHSDFLIVLNAVESLSAVHFLRVAKLMG